MHMNEKTIFVIQADVEKSVRKSLIEMGIDPYGSGFPIVEAIRNSNSYTVEDIKNINFNRSQEVLERLNEFTKRENNPEDVFIFDVVLCDTKIDRDYEKFTSVAIDKLAELYIGKTGFVSNGCTARIFETYVDDYKGNFVLRAKAYMIRTDLNKDIIKEIETGIRKKCSISCSVLYKHCSICGKNVMKEHCSHSVGKVYNGNLCYYSLSGVTDAYEWAFVEPPMLSKTLK